MNKLIFAIILSSMSYCVLGQTLNIDFKNYKQPTYVQFYGENDALELLSNKVDHKGITDHYYTHGSIIDVMGGGFRFSRFLLVKARGGSYTNDYGIQLGQKIYTPDNTEATSIVYNKRPYAGLSYITFKCVSNNFLKGFKLETKLLVGTTGPNSKAGDVQIWYHKLIGQSYPLGWKNQIANGLALDYNIAMSKRIFNLFNFLDVIGTDEISIGSINDYAQVGGLARLGLFNDYFANAYGVYNPRNSIKPIESMDDMNSSHIRFLPRRIRKLPDGPAKYAALQKFINRRINRKFTLNLFAAPYVRYTYYNGLFSGNLLAQQASVYTLDKSLVEKYVAGLQWGANLGLGAFTFTYSEYITTPQVAKETNSKWGSLRVLVRF